jgi:hypothetical protein
VAGEPADRALQEAADGLGAFVLEHLGVGQPGAVVDADVHELPARAAGWAPAPASLAGDPVPDAGDPAEFLDVDVDQLAWHRALVAVLRLIAIRDGAGARVPRA